jgi:phosphoribosylglycinamide formyltransferase-1
MGSADERSEVVPPSLLGKGDRGLGLLFRIGVLVSGRGTNLQAILDAVEAGELAVEVAVVVSNRPDAYALERARRHDVPTVVVPLADYPGRKSHEAAVCAELERAGVDLVVLAGYDRIARHAVLTKYPGRIVNVHPALLPAFAGTLHAQEEALAYGVKIAGCSVHFVTPEVDRGPIVVQRAVEVREDDTVESLKARILAEEHRALPEAIRLIASGRTRIEGRRVVIAPE